MPWYVLYTKPRNEKKTHQLLMDKGVEVYCPMQETIKQWSDRKKKVQEPVFKSYLFVCLEKYEKEQTAVLETPGAVRFLWWHGKPGIVREEEIQAIKDFLNEYKGAQFHSRLTTGEEVMIMEGPLRGQQATIQKIKNHKAILWIPSLGWNVTAEIPLQKLNSSH